MGVGSVCGLIGTLLSIITLVLITVASIVPRFVDVYLVVNADDINEADPIAGIGIFQSFYDSDRVDPQTLADGGAPVDEFTSPTPDFNLLFRAQENFLADIVPVNAEVAAALALAVQNAGIEDAIVALFQPIADLQFVDCQQYITDALNVTTVLFDGLQGPILEGAIAVISTTIGDTFNTALSAIQLFTAPAGTNTNPLELTYLQIINGVATACGTDLATALDANDVTCFVGALDATSIGTLNDFIVAALSTTFAGCDGVTAAVCLSGFNFNFDVVAFGDVQTFGGSNSDTNNVCGALQPALACLVGTTIHTDFLQVYAGVLNEFEALEDAAFGFSLFLNGLSIFLQGGLQGGIFTFTDSTDAVLDAALLDPTIPTTFLDAYPPCELIILLDAVLNITEIQGECTFTNYFAGAAVALEAAESSLAGLVGDLGLLYGICAGTVAPVGSFIAGCPGVFGSIFVSQGVGFDFTNNVDFVTNGLQACEDELTDLEKVEEAQNFLIGSYPFYFISTIAAVVAVALASSATFLYGIAAAASLLAGILTLTALLVVRSAPIYDSVGIEPDGVRPETFFVSGPVQLLAIMCFLIMFVATGFFVGASILLFLEGDTSDEDIDVKGDKQDVAVYAAAADAEPAPAKENPTVTDVGTGKDVSI